MNFKIFDEESFDQVSMENNRRVFGFINKQKKDYILNINEQEFINSVYTKFSYDKLTIHFNKAYLSKYSSKYFDKHVFVITDSDDEKEYCLYHLPFEGSKELLKCHSGRWFRYFIGECYVEGNEILFKILKVDSNYINNEIEKINKIENNLIALNNDIESYNKQLKGIIENNVKDRKKEIRHELDDLNNLSVPLKTNNPPQTYSVPIVQKKKSKIEEHIIIENKLVATIDNELYYNILEVILNRCKTFERTPTFNKFNEEGLRDIIVSDLSTKFDASTTGESFNGKGKTDILMKYKNENLFIAECKIWSGIKNFNSAINQLLAYITLRDTKTAIILFVTRKNIFKVVKEIETNIPKHKNFIKEINNNKEWLEFEFHKNGTHFKLSIIFSQIQN